MRGAIHHVSLECRRDDAAAEIAFWALLGFAEVEPPAGLGARSRWVERAGSQIHVVFADDPVIPSEGHVAVVAEDYADVVARLRERGVAAEPRREYWGAQRTQVRTPAGHTVEIMAFPPAPSA